MSHAARSHIPDGVVLLLVSLGIGVFTADLPFWRRALQLPLPPAASTYPPPSSATARGRSPQPAARRPRPARGLDAAGRLADRRSKRPRIARAPRARAPC